MNTINTMPVMLTSNAIEEIKHLQSQLTEKKSCLRIGVKGGGCAGFSYILDFEEPTNEDNRYELEGIHIAIHPAHEIYLYGVTIDFKNGLENRGFIYENPNASSTCGCGTSFSA